MPSDAPSTEFTAIGKKVLRYRTTDSVTGVTRKTVLEVARQLGMTETQFIHQALAEFVSRVAPQYELPGDEISSQQWEAVDAVGARTQHGKSLGKLF